MEASKKTIITVQVMIDAPIETVWKCWTIPEYITKWNYASDDWHSPWAINDYGQVVHLFSEWKLKTALMVLILKVYMIR